MAEAGRRHPAGHRRRARKASIRLAGPSTKPSLTPARPKNLPNERNRMERHHRRRYHCEAVAGTGIDERFVDHHPPGLRALYGRDADHQRVRGEQLPIGDCSDWRAQPRRPRHLARSAIRDRRGAGKHLDMRTVGWRDMPRGRTLSSRAGEGRSRCRAARETWAGSTPKYGRSALPARSARFRRAALIDRYSCRRAARNQLIPVERSSHVPPRRPIGRLSVRQPLRHGEVQPSSSTKPRRHGLRPAARSRPVRCRHRARHRKCRRAGVAPAIPRRGSANGVAISDGDSQAAGG